MVPPNKALKQNFFQKVAYTLVYVIFFVYLCSGILKASNSMQIDKHIRYMSKQLQIRNSTAEFLIFQAEDKAEGVQVFYKDESIWATQKAMSMLFDCSTDNIGVHLKNIFESGELQQEATTEKISVVQNEGNRQVSRQVQFYKLDAIISVGYRVNSRRAYL